MISCKSSETLVGVDKDTESISNETTHHNKSATQSMNDYKWVKIEMKGAQSKRHKEWETTTCAMLLTWMIPKLFH